MLTKLPKALQGAIQGAGIALGGMTITSVLAALLFKLIGDPLITTLIVLVVLVGAVVGALHKMDMV